MFVWEARIPGKENIDWEGGTLKSQLHFSEDYPTKPPTCKFSPAIFHPNVYKDGKICLSIINDGEDWRPAITMKQVLIGIQELLNNPNSNSPANGEANRLFLKKKPDYTRRVRDEVLKNSD